MERTQFVANGPRLEFYHEMVPYSSPTVVQPFASNLDGMSRMLLYAYGSSGFLMLVVYSRLFIFY